MKGNTLKIIALGVLPWVAATALVALGLPLGTGCVVRADGPAGEIEVAGAPPPPMEESITIAPEPGVIWVGGAWIWSGGGWHWERGRWARPPYGGAHWLAPHYEFRNGHHVFVRGRWH
jgi:hypothetical protein